MPQVQKSIKCEFYSVSCANGARDLSEILLETIVPLSIPERNITGDNGVNRIDFIGRIRDGKYLVGIFQRLRPDNESAVSRLDTEQLNELILPDGQILTEYFAFLYIPELKALVIHRNRDAGGYKRLEAYLERVSGCRPIAISILQNRDALAKLDQMSVRKKLEIKLATGGNMEHLPKSAMTDMARFSHQVDSESLEVILSVGHTKKSIKSAVVNLLKTIVETCGGLVQSAQVRGIIGDTIHVVDLIENQMIEVVTINAESGRPLSQDTLFNVLINAFERKEDEIARLAREPRNA